MVIFKAGRISSKVKASSSRDKGSHGLIRFAGLYNPLQRFTRGLIMRMTSQTLQIAASGHKFEFHILRPPESNSPKNAKSLGIGVVAGHFICTINYFLARNVAFEFLTCLWLE